MKYTNVICSYLKESGESWSAFACRAGVSRAALYKTLKGKQNPRIDSVEKLLSAAGYELMLVPAPPATPPAAASPEETADAAAPVPRRRGRPRRHSEGTPAAGAGAGGGGSGAPECGAGAA